VYLAILLAPLSTYIVTHHHATCFSQIFAFSFVTAEKKTETFTCTVGSMYALTAEAIAGWAVHYLRLVTCSHSCRYAGDATSRGPAVHMGVIVDTVSQLNPLLDFLFI
jgi:hypothetical protein